MRAHQEPAPCYETELSEVMPVLKDIDYALKHLRGWMRVQRRQADRLAFGLASNRVVPQPMCVSGVDIALPTTPSKPNTLCA